MVSVEIDQGTKRTRAAEASTDLILDVFRLNGLLLTAGDRMVARLGLTSTRWQVLGAIDDAERAQPVAWLARDMGGKSSECAANRERLAEDGARDTRGEPASPASVTRRADRQGALDVRRGQRVQPPWANGLSEDLAIKDIDTTRRVVAALRKKLELNGQRAST